MFGVMVVWVKDNWIFGAEIVKYTCVKSFNQVEHGILIEMSFLTLDSQISDDGMKHQQV
jgi:hypothetical protein